MCRFVAIHGYINKTSYEVLKITIDSLMDASRWDKYSDFKLHDDGWGFSVFTMEDILLYKSIKPIWNDEEGLRKLKSIILSLNMRKASIIVHARKASSNTPREVLDAHPFIFKLADGNYFSFAHNGAFDLSKLGYATDNEMLVRSDSYIYSKEVLSKATYNTILQVIQEFTMKGVIKTAMNSVISIKTQADLTTIAINYYLNNNPLYYDMYYLEIKDLHIIGSSTNMEKVAESLARLGLLGKNLEKLGNHGVLVCRDKCNRCVINDLKDCSFNL